MGREPRPTAKQKVPAARIRGFVRDLNVIDVDVSKVGARISRAGLDLGGDVGACIIHCDCCIIDCSKCKPEDMEIFENPANVLEGFMFRLRALPDTADAPIFYLPQLDARTAMRMGHGSVSLPGDGKVAGKLIGLIGEFVDVSRLGGNVSPTAPVIALSSKAAG